MKTIYIAGKVSGLSPIQSYGNFMRCQYKVEHMSEDYRVINPVLLCKSSWPWWLCMVKCLFHLCCKADAIYMQNNWQSSRGARIEYKVAKILGKEVWYE